MDKENVQFQIEVEEERVINISTIDALKENCINPPIEDIKVKNNSTSNSKSKKKISLTELKSKAKQMDIDLNNIVSIETKRNTIDYNNMLSNNKNLIEEGVKLINNQHDKNLNSIDLEDRLKTTNSAGFTTKVEKVEYLPDQLSIKNLLRSELASNKTISPIGQKVSFVTGITGIKGQKLTTIPSNINSNNYNYNYNINYNYPDGISTDFSPISKSPILKNTSTKIITSRNSNNTSLNKVASGTSKKITNIKPKNYLLNKETTSTKTIIKDTFSTNKRKYISNSMSKQASASSLNQSITKQRQIKPNISTIINNKTISTTSRAAIRNNSVGSTPVKSIKSQASQAYIKRTIHTDSKSAKISSSNNEKDKLEEYFLKIKVHTDLLEAEYRKYKEKYYKYKSKYTQIKNYIKQNEIELKSSSKNLDHLGLMLKGYCDFSFQDSNEVSNQFQQEEKNVLVDLFSHCNTNSYSNLIKNLCCSIYNVKQRPDIEFSDASEDE